MTSVSTLARPGSGSTVYVPRRPAAWMSLCVVAIALGTGFVIRAYSTARTTADLDYVTIFWIGYFIALAGLFGLAFIARGSSSGFAVAVALGIWTYLPKFLMSLHGPVYFDEWGHFRHLEDLARTGNILGNDNFLPIVKYFPGLSLVSYAIQVITRTSAWTAAVLTSVLAHTATAGAVYRIAERIGLSVRRSVFATLLYAIGPSFTFFDAQYGYETLGLALAFWTIASALSTITLCASALPRGQPETPLAGRGQGPRGQFVRRSLATATLGVCTVFTHHLSALITSAMLVVILAMTARAIRDPHRRAALIGVVATCVVATVLWIGVVAKSAAYLAPKVISGVQQILQIVGLLPGGTSTGPAQRSVLSATAVPRYEILCGYAAIGVLVIAYGVALIALWRRRRRDRGLYARFRWFFALLGACFFMSLPLILTTTGAEVAHRSWAFSWLGLATTLAGTPIRRWTKRISMAAIAIGTSMFVLVAIGMAADGTNADYRFPGPYQFGSDSRSLNPDEYRLARWFASTGRSGGVITDHFTGCALTGYTRLDTPNAATQIELYRVFTDPLHIPADVANSMRRSGYVYFVVDSNFIGRLPVKEDWYPGSYSYYPVQQHGLETLLKRRGSAQLKLIKQIGHYFVFELS